MLVEDLVRLPLFQELTPEQLKRLAPLFRHVSFQAGSHAFQEGDDATQFYVLESGEVTIQFYPSDGGCLDIAKIQPGGVFGWSAALGRPRYTSTALCGTAVQALAAPGSELRKIMVVDPELGAVLLERMAQVVASRFDGLATQLSGMLHGEMLHGDDGQEWDAGAGTGTDAR